ncbi:response regulator [Bradyrhizobium sp.]|uniref:response regulator transcription factor n=1 Tax=Bradyrhizobium sp. TaxID=376 RepID=UPI0025C60B00|nr:response regulator [Bradyrhizobium sp.]
MEPQQLDTILVVEDDREIQALIRDALGESGFKPAVAASGEEALDLLKANKGRYCALVADIVLPGRMSGWEVATMAREIDPEFPVLYVTGAHAHQWKLRGVANSGILTKPFATQELVSAVSRLLAAAH